MKALIKLLDSTLECSDIVVENQTVTFHSHSSAAQVDCRYCHFPSTRVHAKYIHQIQDLSIQNMTVYIFLTTCRFICSNSDCPYHTFAESFSFVSPHAKKTTRLVNQITEISLTQSSLSAPHQLHDLGVVIEKSSICNYLKKSCYIDKSSITDICIDDFALKRRFKYGTVMVNLKTGKIIDLIESRETNVVSEWLGTFPNIELVSRDGSQSYAKAIKDAFPDASQVSDRFQLLSRLCEIGTKFLYSNFPSRLPIIIEDSREEAFEDFLLYASRRDKILYVRQLKREKGLTAQEIRMKTGFGLQTISTYLLMLEENIPKEKITQRERDHRVTTEAKIKQVKEVHNLVEANYGVSEIADITGLTFTTVKRYLEPNHSPSHAQYGDDFPGRLAAYRQQVLALPKERHTYAEIYSVIKTAGYTGTVDAIRGYMSKQRRIHKDLANKYIGKSIEIIERKWLAKLLYLPIEKVPVIENADLLRIFQEYPVYHYIYQIVWAFKSLLMNQVSEPLTQWLLDAKEVNFGELTSFVNGIEKDQSAIIYAIEQTESNGLAEGSVNKIKTIKRQMYGRNKFELLRQKVLKLEFWRST